MCDCNGKDTAFDVVLRYWDEIPLMTRDKISKEIKRLKL